MRRLEDNHWTDEDLLDRLYGIGRADTHLDECGNCQARWQALMEARRRVIEPPVVDEAFLAAQCREIYRRLDAGDGRARWRWVPALAMAGVALLAVVVSRPVPAPAPSLALNEPQFFAEVQDVASSYEPQSVVPILGLFEEKQ